MSETAPPPAAGERLDYAAFLARFFPNRHRHDFEAITAYTAYRNELEPPDPAAQP
jgi:hypothetical protein